MTNKEALQAQFNFPLKESAFDLALTNQGLAGEETYTLENKSKVDLALAELIFIAATSPASVRELDYQISQQTITELLKLRSLILARNNVPDELAYQGAIIQDATHFWGTTDY